MAEDPKKFLKRMNNRPNDSASILGETPQNVLLLAGAEELRRKRIVEAQRQRDAQLILENIQERPVFFYPGAGSDWEPLHRLTHECSVFVYCDWERQAGAVTGEFQLPGLSTEFIVTLSQGTVRDLSDASRFHPHIWRIVKQVGGPPVEPWGKYARLARSVGNITRTIHFFYLRIEGVTTFFNLFTPVRTAPKIICLKGAGGIQRNWTNFHDWDRPLGHMPIRFVDIVRTTHYRWGLRFCNMNKKPTVRQALDKARKEIAALDAGILELKQRPQRIRDYYSKPKRELDAHLRKVKEQIEAPRIEAEKRRIIADKESRARIERPIKEFQARIAQAKREHEALLAPALRSQQKQMAAGAKPRRKP